MNSIFVEFKLTNIIKICCSVIQITVPVNRCITRKACSLCGALAVRNLCLPPPMLLFQWFYQHEATIGIIQEWKPSLNLISTSEEPSEKVVTVGTVANGVKIIKSQK